MKLESRKEYILPKTSANENKKLGELSSDCSFILTHLIRQNDQKNDKEAKQILDLILDINSETPSPRLKASSVGWYASAGAKLFNTLTKEFDEQVESKAICFTESTLHGLHSHSNLFDSKYGLAFRRSFLYKNNANPCLNIREDRLKNPISYGHPYYYKKVFNLIPKDLVPFINIISLNFDPTHEREWRIANDVEFDYSDILFLFCPAGDFKEYSKIQKNGLPSLLDLDWLNKF